MADFTLIAGRLGHCVPSAKAPDGTTVVPFPASAVFAWSASDPSITFSDPTSASPDVTGSTALTGATITMDVVEDGFKHSASHTVDVVAAPTDTIGTVDFTVQ